MNSDLKARLLDLKARQDAGERMLCPRCGNDSMKLELHTNALSRHANVYVCDACGINEAMLDYMNAPLPLGRWACFAPKRPMSDLEDRSVTDAIRELKKGRIQYLCSLCKRWAESNDGDFEALSHEAYENCAGLQELWPEPFRAVFATKEFLLHVRFKYIDEQVLVAINPVKK